MKGILVNIFGGIMDCNVIATGILAAAKEVSLNIPLVVRLEGNNVDAGKKTLAESGLAVISASDLADAANKIVAAVKKAAWNQTVRLVNSHRNPQAQLMRGGGIRH